MKRHDRFLLMFEVCWWNLAWDLNFWEFRVLFQVSRVLVCLITSAFGQVGVDFVFSLNFGLFSVVGFSVLLFFTGYFLVIYLVPGIH